MRMSAIHDVTERGRGSAQLWWAINDNYAPDSNPATLLWRSTRIERLAGITFMHTMLGISPGSHYRSAHSQDAPPYSRIVLSCARGFYFCQLGNFFSIFSLARRSGVSSGISCWDTDRHVGIDILNIRWTRTTAIHQRPREMPARVSCTTSSLAPNL